MRKTLLLLATLLVLPFAAIAQDDDFDINKQEDIPEEAQAAIRVMVNPFMRAILEEGADRTGVFISLMADNPLPMFASFKEELGITEEQLEQFNDYGEIWRETEEVAVLMNKLDDLFEKIEEDPNYIPTEEETTVLELITQSMVNTMNVAAEGIFTEEQMERSSNMLFAMTGGLQSPFLCEKHMDALEMTDEQRAKFKQINEETRPEREKMIAAFDAEIQRMTQTGKMSVKDFLGALSKFQQLGSTLKKRRTEVLTRAQLAKVTQMMKMPKSMTFSLLDFFSPWAPDANSWKPGDPIPGGIQMPVRPAGRFPRGGETEE